MYDCNMEQKWHVYPPPRGYSARLGDEVFIRPKSGKELGLAGRIVQLLPPKAASIAVQHVPLVGARPSSDDDAANNSEEKKKKRKREEPMRAVVSIRQSRSDSSSSSPDLRGDIRPSRLVKLYASASASSPASRPSTNIIVTGDTVNFRILAASQVRPDDFVLEVGCSTGECTAVLARYVSSDNGGRIVAFDTGESMIATAKTRVRAVLDQEEGRESDNDDVSFHKVDALQDPRGALRAIVEATSGSISGEQEVTNDAASTQHRRRHSPRYPDVVFIDIGGNREIDGVARMVHWVLHAFEYCPPRLIVVKSKEMVGELWKASRNNTVLLNIDDNDGAVHYARDWFSLLVDSLFDTHAAKNPSESTDCGNGNGNESKEGGDGMVKRRRIGPPRFSHPLKAPLALSPVDDATPICRFHNYHPDGCKKGEGCDFDHNHCHYCLKKGHIARDCVV